MEMFAFQYPAQSNELGTYDDEPPTISSEGVQALVATVETMLLDSYSRNEGSEQWWARFSAYYVSLAPEIRASFVCKLDWLFCSHGETGWYGVRLGLDAQ